MVFSEPIFLFVFLPLIVAVILLARVLRAFNLALLTTSVLFYYWASGPMMLLLVASFVANWYVGLRIAQTRQRIWLTIGVAANVLVLATFKYAIFFAENVDGLLRTDLSPHVRWIILPIGVSFYTFQGISYLIDIWRRDIDAERKLVVFGAYQTFFAHLVAGPIVRFKSVIADFHAPKINVDNMTAGAARFAHGLFKKVVIADSAGAIADACFALTGPDLTMGAAWLGALAYTVQIYFDFSAYSDMAIGLAYICGIRFEENFNRPYTSSTLTEFWRRWHISLSTWFRDYVYIPLGGNRHGRIATYRNLLIVFFVTGLWHGAAWTFVLWGLYHGAFIILERLSLGRAAEAIDSPAARFGYLLPVVIFGWILFRSENLPQAIDFYRAMLGAGVSNVWALPEIVSASATPLLLAGLCLGLIALVAPKSQSFGVRLTEMTNAPGALLRLGYTTVAMTIGAAFALSSDFSPFLYFRF